MKIWLDFYGSPFTPVPGFPKHPTHMTLSLHSSDLLRFPQHLDLSHAPAWGSNS